VAVAPPRELVQVSHAFINLVSINLRATDDSNYFGWDDIRRNVNFVGIPHVSTLLSEIQVVRTPSCWAVTSFGDWESASDNEHLATVDHITRQGIVWIASPGTLPPLDPLERWKTEYVNVVETSVICTESKASIEIST
jgi:hypothetical protein